MNNVMRNVAVMFGMTFMVMVTGCHSTLIVTRDYPNYVKPSQQDAMNLLVGRAGRPPISDNFFYIKTVDATGFEYGACYCTNSSLNFKHDVGYFVLGGVVGVIGYRHQENIDNQLDPKLRNSKDFAFKHFGYVKFSDVTKIEVLMFPHNNDGCLRLFLNNESYNYLDILCCKDEPELNDSLVSALLVLCPNAGG